MANSKVVYNDFAPTSAELAPLAAQYAKLTSEANKVLEQMREITHAKLQKAGKLDEASKGRFRIGSRWGKWAWWITEEAKASKATGEQL